MAILENVPAGSGFNTLVVITCVPSFTASACTVSCRSDALTDGVSPVKSLGSRDLRLVRAASNALLISSLRAR